MRRLLVGMAIIATLSMTLSTWAGDREIAEKIITTLKVQRDAGKLKKFDLDLKVNKGVVVMQGTISSPAQREMILAAAKEAQGVKNIVDELKLQTAGSSTNASKFVEPRVAKADDTKPEAVKSKANVIAALPPVLLDGKEKTAIKAVESGKTKLASAVELVRPKTAAKNVVPAVPTPRQKPRPVKPVQIVGQHAAPAIASAEQDRQLNASITKAITKAKNAGKLRGFALDITTNQGDVWLQGRTITTEQRNTMLEIVRFVPGVRNVIDDIQVMMSEQSRDNMVRQASDVAEVPAPPKTLTTIPTRPLKDPIASSAPSPVPTPAAVPVRRAATPVREASPIAAATPRPAMQRAPARLMRVPYNQRRMPQPFATASNGIPVHGASAMQAQPMPMQAASGGVAYGAPRYDQPNLPNYAWPGYSAYPNYAALAYPKQYSPSAWPFIGPFYPYPQVPLNWRKVTLQWDDGWWFLDYSSKSR